MNLKKQPHQSRKKNDKPKETAPKQFDDTPIKPMSSNYYDELKKHEEVKTPPVKSRTPNKTTRDNSKATTRANKDIKAKEPEPTPTPVSNRSQQDKNPNRKPVNVNSAYVQENTMFPGAPPMFFPQPYGQIAGQQFAPQQYAPQQYVSQQFAPQQYAPHQFAGQQPMFYVPVPVPGAKLTGPRPPILVMQPNGMQQAPIKLFNPSTTTTPRYYTTSSSPQYIVDGSSRASIAAPGEVEYVRARASKSPEKMVYYVYD